MKKAITFENAALAMLKSSLIDYLEITTFNPDCIFTRESIFRKKVKVNLVKSAVSKTKYAIVEPKSGSKLTIGDVYVDFPTPGRKNHCIDVTVIAEVVVDYVSDREFIKEFEGELDETDLCELQNRADIAIDSVSGQITAICRMEIVKFGNVWSPVSVTVDIDGRKEWDDFLSGYDTFDCSLSRTAKIDTNNPEFCDDFKDLLSL